MKRRIVLITALILFIAALILGVFVFALTEAETQINVSLRIAFFSTAALLIPFVIAGLLLGEADPAEE